MYIHTTHLNVRTYMLHTSDFGTANYLNYCRGLCLNAIIVVFTGKAAMIDAMAHRCIESQWTFMTINSAKLCSVKDVHCLRFYCLSYIRSTSVQISGSPTISESFGGLLFGT